MNISIYNRLNGISGFLSVFSFILYLHLFFGIAAILQIYQLEDLAPEIVNLNNWNITKNAILTSIFVQFFCYSYAIYLLYYESNKKSFNKIIEIIWGAGPVIYIFLAYIAHKFDFFVFFEFIFGEDIKVIVIGSISKSLFWTAYFYKSKRVYVNFFESENIKLFINSLNNFDKFGLKYLLNTNKINNEQKSYGNFYQLEKIDFFINSLKDLKVVNEQELTVINSTILRDANSDSVNNSSELGDNDQMAYNNLPNNTEIIETSIIDDEEYYFEATKEWDDGRIDSKLWSKSIAVNNGDELKAKYYYIRSRVEKLKEAIESKKEAIEKQNKINKFINNCKNDEVYLRKILNLKNFKVTIGSNNNYYIFDSNGLYKAINGDAELSEFLLEHFVNSREDNS